MTSSAIGLLLSAALLIVATARSRGDGRSYYEGRLYDMTPGAHRRYAAAFAGFAALFAAGIVWRAVPAVPALAVFCVVAILYGATFIRGAIGEDETP